MRRKLCCRAVAPAAHLKNWSRRVANFQKQQRNGARCKWEIQPEQTAHALVKNMILANI